MPSESIGEVSFRPTKVEGEHFAREPMNDTQRSTYRALIKRECDEMRCAAAIFKRTDISGDEKLLLFKEVQVLIREYENDAEEYLESIMSPKRPV